MVIRVLGSTHPGYVLPKEEAIVFSGKAAGICYEKTNLDDLFNEPRKSTLKRAKGTIARGHHSVFGHVYYNLALEGIPKILAMVLNNEKVYCTSEKSGRYTIMGPRDEERNRILDQIKEELKAQMHEFNEESEECKERLDKLYKEKLHKLYPDLALYEKWIPIFKEQIAKEYPSFEDKQVEKLAVENARYLISVFTPATDLEYTVDFRQLNYIINWLKDYIADDSQNTPFAIMLKNVFKEFLAKLPDVEVEGLDTKVKGRKLSLFATRDRREEFGENYSINYEISMTILAHSHRHRTLSYEMSFLDKFSIFVPPIIKGTPFEAEWIKDAESVSDLFPQGMLVKVNERGTIENFVLKCKERLCGAPQLEIMQATRDNMQRYLEAVKDDKDLYEYLLPYSKGPRCTFPGFKCTSPCVFGPKGAFTRKI